MFCCWLAWTYSYSDKRQKTCSTWYHFLLTRLCSLSSAAWANVRSHRPPQKTYLLRDSRHVLPSTPHHIIRTTLCSRPGNGFHSLSTIVVAAFLPVVLLVTIPWQFENVGRESPKQDHTQARRDGAVNSSRSYPNFKGIFRASRGHAYALMKRVQRQGLKTLVRRRSCTTPPRA